MNTFCRKFLLALLMPTLLFGAASAQTVGTKMTDQKVMEYITQASEEGKSQQDIAKQLISWGVSTEQLRRVRDRYRSEMEKQRLGNRDQNNGTAATTGSNGLREQNSEITRINDEMEAALGEMLDPDDTPVENRPTANDSIFGHNIFNNDKLSFEPNMNINAPQNYVLGPGDEVVIDIFGASQSSFRQFVNAEGIIVVDQYGPLSVGGFTLAQADKLIRREIGSMYESSSVRVSIGQTRTILINVMGEVNVPGTYHLSAFSTVFHALYASGGISELGTLRNIKVFRSGREISTIDVYDFILNGQMQGNVRLQDNDVIIVGTYESIVKAEGSIKRPMKYEMKRGETLAHLLKYVGGFAANAYTDAVRVSRSNGKFSTAYNVTSQESGAFQLEDGDVITVDQHQDRYENIVEVRGAAFRPGIYHIGNSVNTVRQLIEMADGLTETAVGHHALMYRMNSDRTHSLLAVDIDAILAGTKADIPLESEDILYIPSNENALQKRFIEVQGEVFNPGTYDYADNETIEDVVLQAGGLLESASTVRVDVARQIRDEKALGENGDRRAEFFTFELQNGLIINPDPTFHLQPYDQIYIRRSPSYYDQMIVEVKGQVMFEGLYAITKQNERLSDLIQKAGGLKSFAYAKGANLQRQLTAEEKFQIEIQIADAEALFDTLKVETLRKRLEAKYTVGIDLELALANPGSHEDLVLREGDLLVIPQYDNTVKVSGEVYFPNTLTYTRGKSAKYYINQAGGYDQRASRRKGYIIYKNGQVARIRKGAKVEPGCEIVIPEKPDRDFTSRASTYIAIASSLATITALIMNIFK